MKKLENQDPLLIDALRAFVDENRVSTSLLQRIFLIGFPRAARIIDQLEELGLVTYDIDAEKRKLLITENELNDIIANME